MTDDEQRTYEPPQLYCTVLYCQLSLSKLELKLDKTVNLKLSVCTVYTTGELDDDGNWAREDAAEPLTAPSSMEQLSARETMSRKTTKKEPNQRKQSTVPLRLFPCSGENFAVE